MTEPERPVGSPGNPTPEEISARLEALLKRTHTLRAQRSAQAASGAPLDITWPPPDRELEHYDVVDVAHGHTSPASSERPAARATEPAPAATPSAGESSPEFARPDWSELRLRTAGDDRGGRSSWLWMATILLALATLGQAAYILYLHTALPAPVSGRLRVDGPEGAQVRVNGRPVGIAPVDHALEPGSYAVEIVQANGLARADDVIIGLGRTVVVTVSSTTPTSGESTAAAATPTPSAAGTGATPALPVRTPGAASAAPAPQGATPSGLVVTATLGAVRIESVPPGAPVTMGGRPRGVTPVTIPLVWPGRHDVMIGGVFKQVEIRPNEVATLRVP